MIVLKSLSNGGKKHVFGFSQTLACAVAILVSQSRITPNGPAV